MQPVPLAADDGTACAVSLALKLQGFFPEFKLEHLQKIFPRSGLFAYSDGAAVVSQGEEGQDLFVVLEGSVIVRQEMGSAGAEVATLGCGAIVGEIALLEGGARTATVVAAGEAKLFRLAAADLRYLLANNRELSEHLKALACRRKG